MFTDHFYVTHGNAESSINNNNEKFYLVDWYEPILVLQEWEE